MLCGEAVKESDLVILGVDYKWAGMYVALNSTKTDITKWGIQDLVPSRRYVNGTRPGIPNVGKNSDNS